MLLPAVLFLTSLTVPSASCPGLVPPALDSATGRADSLAVAERVLAGAHGAAAGCDSAAAAYVMALEAGEDGQVRQHAADLLAPAFAANDDSPRLFLAYGVLYYYRHSLTDALRILNRAEARVDNATPPLSNHERAVLHYVRGLIYQDYWRDARSLGHLASTADINCSAIDDQTSADAVSAEQQCWYVADSVYAHLWQDQSGQGRYRFNLETDDFEAAMKLEPSWPAPALRLAEDLVYGDEYEPARDVLRRALRDSPDDPDLLATLGAVLHALRRDSLALLAFDSAFTRMTPEARRVYSDIHPLLSHKNEQRLDAADSAHRVASVAEFWRSEDPLYLTPLNERRIEHYARVATANLLFGVPTMGLAGWDTDGGQTWIRYGRPRHMYEEGPPEGGRTTHWFYGPVPHLHFVFTRGLTYRRYRASEATQLTLQRLKFLMPEFGSPALATISTLDYQLVRLLGEDGKPQVLVYAAPPEHFMDGSQVGLTLLDDQFRTIASWKGKFRARDGIAANLHDLKHGDYALALEAWDPGQEKLARVRDTVAVPSFSGRTLALSDLLVATHIHGGKGRVTRRSQLDITPSYGLTLRAGARIGLYWEIYGLTPDSAGTWRYEVSVEVKRGREGFAARIANGISNIFGHAEHGTKLQYTATLPRDSSADRAVEWLELAGVSRPGVYHLHVRVRDLVAGTEREGERQLFLCGAYKLSACGPNAPRRN